MVVDREPRSLPPEIRPPVVIQVESVPDPNPSSIAFGLPATQRQIDYKVTLNNQPFVFPDVWVLQTTEIGEDGKERTESYFDPKTGAAIDEAMFRHLHPK